RSRFRNGWVPLVKGPGLEPKTVRNVHIMLHAALADAVRWRYVEINVADDVKPPRVARRKPSVWTPAQVRTFLRAARKDRFCGLYLLAATTGFRRGELCGLCWSAIDLDAATVAVHPDDPLVDVSGRAQSSEGKSDQAPRLLSLDVVTIAALRERKKARQRFDRIASRSGLPNIRFHDIRHSYATAALGSGIPLKIISARLGHASPEFTARVYQHVLPAMDQKQRPRSRR
ncbi:MAG TPA: site-specific integrase, partial [Nocardioidaceae bacterium]|nr:site-specific integrase [Nocardioidaceae bacterium]